MLLLAIGTGLDAAGKPLAHLGYDANWTVDQAGGGIAPAQVVMPGDADYWSDFSAWDVWLANSSQSAWIARTAVNQFQGAAPYTFHYSFFLTSYFTWDQAATAVLTGGWAVDDQATLKINGTIISTLGEEGWAARNGFSTAGYPGLLRTGLNTIDITMTWNDALTDAARLQAVVRAAPAAPVLLEDDRLQLNPDQYQLYVNAYTDSARQVVTGEAEANGTVTVYDNLNKLGIAIANATGDWAFVLGRLDDGPHSLTATVTDADGTSAASAALAFTVDTVAPTVTLAALSSASHQTARGTSEAGTTVHVLDGGTDLGSTTVAGDGSWSIGITLGKGVHSITANDLDAAGNAGISAAQALTVGLAHDFLADGTDDILWRNTDGSLWQWDMANGRIAGGGGTWGIDNSWTVLGRGDFAGDGHAGILWRHDDGVVWLTTMNGAAITGGGYVGTIDNSWSVLGIADFNGDGRADILWHNTSTGAYYLWAMNGNAIDLQVDYGVVPGAWHVVG